MHDVSLYLLDIIENSVRAGATVIATSITASRSADTLVVCVEDDGPGLPVSVDEVMDPFYTTKAGKKTGLGLSLFRQAAEAAGGELVVAESAELGGVAVKARMRLADVDRPPLGDVASTLFTMALTNPGIEFRVALYDDDGSVLLRGAELQRQRSAIVAFQEALT